MAEGLGSETHAASVPHEDGVVPPQPLRGGPAAWRALLFVGIAVASAGLAFVVVRAAFRQPPPDPTTERIQALIDEANRLLKQLDDQKKE